MIRSRSGRAAGLLLGAALDAALADPRRRHPVAAFGSLAGQAEARLWADSRGRGAAHLAVCLLPVTTAGLATGRLTRGHPVAAAAVTALASWAVLGGTSLRREALALGRALEAGDLPAARQVLPALCGRDPGSLDAAGLARAAVESVAENTSDAVVAPLLWGAAFGLPGLLGYRAVNTLDAMIGHRSPRYQRFGWAAARLDDAANLIPARVTGLLAAAPGARPWAGAPGPPCAPCAGTATSIPARTRAGVRPRSPGRSASGSAARTATRAGWSSAACWVTAGRWPRPT